MSRKQGGRHGADPGAEQVKWKSCALTAMSDALRLQTKRCPSFYCSLKTDSHPHPHPPRIFYGVLLAIQNKILVGDQNQNLGLQQPKPNLIAQWTAQATWTQCHHNVFKRLPTSYLENRWQSKQGKPLYSKRKDNCFCIIF